MDIRFGQIAINQTFQVSRINTGHSASVYGAKAIMVYRKTTGNRAQCINQIGYGNTRSITGIYGFTPNSKVEINN